MGRIKPRPLKAITKEAFSLKEDGFTTDFSTNKQSAMGILDVRSKKLRNVIAGYATRLKKQKN